MFLLVLQKVAPLLVAIGLGYLAGVTRVFSAPTKAIDVLNRYALYFGFPILIFQGFCQPNLILSPNPGFYLLHILLAISLVCVVLVLSRVSSTARQVRGNLVLGALFGNVAYLGLPLATALLGQEQLGLISLSVALQVFLAMLLGPLFLLMWQGAPTGAEDGATEASRTTWERIGRPLLRQPLLWAPVVGLSARLLPVEATGFLAGQLKLFAASAAPVALFLLGLHIWVHQRSLRQLSKGTWALLLCKLLLVPGCAVLLGGGFVWMGWITPPEWRVLLVLGTMPTAITTFSIARDMRLNEGLMAQAILLSTLFFLLLLSFVMPWLLQLAT